MVFICSLLGWLGAKLMRAKGDRAGIAIFSVAFTNTVFVGFP